MYYLDGYKSEISLCLAWISGRVNRKKQRIRKQFCPYVGKNGRMAVKMQRVERGTQKLKLQCIILPKNQEIGKN